LWLVQTDGINSGLLFRNSKAFETAEQEATYQHGEEKNRTGFPEK